MQIGMNPPSGRQVGGKRPRVDPIAKRGIRLMLCFPTGMGIGDINQAKRTASVIGELSLRYGKRVSGWWLDNNSCYHADRQKLIAMTARAGNPDS